MNDLRPESLARDLAHQMVRTFAGVDAVLREQRAASSAATADAVVDELEATIAARLDLMCRAFPGEDLNTTILLLAEAADHLGLGDFLEPARVAAFAAASD